MNVTQCAAVVCDACTTKCASRNVCPRRVVKDMRIAPHLGYARKRYPTRMCRQTSVDKVFKA